MIYQIRLYKYHDEDLIQLISNGVILRDLFTEAVRAHCRNTEFKFELPEHMSFKDTKGRIFRSTCVLDDAKDKDVIGWLAQFPERHLNHCIKNIARVYLGSTVFDMMNAYYKEQGAKQTVKKENNNVKIQEKVQFAQDGTIKNEWIDEISARKVHKSEMTEDKIQAKEHIYQASRNEILGRETFMDNTIDDHRKSDDQDVDALTEEDKRNKIEDNDTTVIHVVEDTNTKETSKINDTDDWDITPNVDSTQNVYMNDEDGESEEDGFDAYSFLIQMRDL